MQLTPGVERSLKVGGATAGLVALELLVLGCGSPPPIAAPFENPGVALVIQSALPRGWRLEESKPDQIPYGHDQNFTHGGRLLVLVGPQDAYFDWQGRDDVWHHDPVFSEALKVWIMPPNYSDSWGNFFDFHRPASPLFVWSGPTATVYGMVTNHLKPGADLGDSIRLAKVTVGREVRPSWASWKEDIRGHLSKVIRD